MMAMNEFAEFRRTPSLNHVSAQSPRVGGCVGTFFHMFDWNSGKKIFTTKRLPAERLEEEHYVRRERSYKESNAKLHSMNLDKKREVARAFPLNQSSCGGSPESSKSGEDPNKRVPGVVARLMGLESLPEATSSSAAAEEEEASLQETLSPSPVLLQDLLRHEGFRNPRNPLKEKLPQIFSRKLPDQKHRTESPRTKASVTRAQCLVASDSNSHGGVPYVDPKPPRHRKSEGAKQTFLSRLTQSEPPVLLPSKSHNQLVSSSMRSPSSSSSFVSKRTAKLLEAAAAKILEPSMQSSSRLLTSPSQSCHYTQSESGMSTNSERRGGGSFGHSRGGSGLYSSLNNKILRTESMAHSWNGKEEELGEISGRISEPGSVNKPSRKIRGAVPYHDLIHKGEQASKWRFQTALAAAHAEAVSLSSHSLVRKPNQASAGLRSEATANTVKHVLGTHESSIHRFKTELGAKVHPKTVDVKKGSSNHSRSKSETSDLIMDLHHGRRKARNKTLQGEVSTTSLRTELPLAHHEIVGTEGYHQNLECTSLHETAAVQSAFEEGEVVTRLSSGMVKANLANDSLRSAPFEIVEPSGSGRPPPCPHPRPPNDRFSHHALWGFKAKPGRQERDAGSPGNRVSPLEKAVGPRSDLQQVRPDTTAVPAVEATTGGSLLRYSWPFNLPKPSDKKEGQEKGEGLVLKRPENVFMRSILRCQTAPYQETGPQKRTGQMFSTSSKAGRNQQGNTNGARRCIRDATRKLAAVVQSGGQLIALDTPPSIGSNLCQNLSSQGEEETLTTLTLPNQKVEGIEGSLNMRARSIDDVFPELPMEGPTISDITYQDLAQITTDITEKQFLEFKLHGQEKVAYCQSGERVFGRSPDMFVTECLGWFPNSPLIDYKTVFFPEREIHSNLEQFFVTDGRGGGDGGGSNSPFNRELTFGVTTTQESQNLKCPQEQKNVTLSDDAGSVGADLNTRMQANCNAGGSPNCLEMQQKMNLDAGWSKEDAASPILLKKFSKNSPVSTKLLNTAECQLANLSLGVDECGQPSPVSVLASRFLDDSPTTPETSLTETEQLHDEGLEEDMSSSSCGVFLGIKPLDKRQQEADEAAAQLEIVTSERNETENIKQALLTISQYYNIDISNIRLEGATTTTTTVRQESPQDCEKDHVQETLEASWFGEFKDATSSQNWVLPQLPALNPSLFDRQEFGSIELSEQPVMESKNCCSDISGHCQDQVGSSSWRCNRKLLFDSVNKALVLQFDCEYCACVEPRMNVRISVRPRSLGSKLVADIYKKVCEWRGPADDFVDKLISQDLSVTGGKWTGFSQEVVEVGLDVEQILLKIMIEELVDDVHHLQRGSSLSPSSLQTSIN